MSEFDPIRVRDWCTIGVENVPPQSSNPVAENAGDTKAGEEKSASSSNAPDVLATDDINKSEKTNIKERKNTDQGDAPIVCS